MLIVATMRMDLKCIQPSERGNTQRPYTLKDTVYLSLWKRQNCRDRIINQWLQAGRVEEDTLPRSMTELPGVIDTFCFLIVMITIQSLYIDQNSWNYPSKR